jgi:hypothetical protein
VSARRQSLAADIRLEVARVLDQVNYLQTRTDEVSAYALPLAKNRLEALIADHRVVVTGNAP